MVAGPSQPGKKEQKAVKVLSPSPQLAEQNKLIANALIVMYYGNSSLEDEEIEEALAFVAELEKDLSQTMKGIRMEVFGSLINGFASVDSDIDVCVHFSRSRDELDEEPPKDMNAKNVLRVISRLLHRRGIRNAPVLTPAVPLIKCELKRPWEIGMDISFYNTLALINSDMLATYCDWEPDRLPQLGLWVKKWAKTGEILGANRGYISAYGLITMLIHYLQNCQPAVLPRLQEDFRTAATPIETHCGYDIYYHHHEIEEKWSKNRQSVGELFLGFLDFYTKFDFSTQAIQIKGKQPLTKEEFKKLLENKKNKPLMIQDPFQLDRNLCGGLSNPSFKKIRGYFDKSKEVFSKLGEDKQLMGVHDGNINEAVEELFKSCRVIKVKKIYKPKPKKTGEKGAAGNEKKDKEKANGHGKPNQTPPSQANRAKNPGSPSKATGNGQAPKTPPKENRTAGSKPSTPGKKEGVVPKPLKKDGGGGQPNASGKVAQSPSPKKAANGQTKANLQVKPPPSGHMNQGEVAKKNKTIARRGRKQRAIARQAALENAAPAKSPSKKAASGQPQATIQAKRLSQKKPSEASKMVS